jgi:hypothetical protein
MPFSKVPFGEWPAFLEGFALQHYGWLCSISDRDVANPPPDAAFDHRLRGLVLAHEGKDDSRLAILSESARQVIRRPCEIEEEKTADGVSSGVRITSADGSVTRLRLRTPIAPELVDGMPP